LRRFRRRLGRLRSLSCLQWRIVLVSLVLVPLVQLSLKRRGFARTADALARRSQAAARPSTPDEVRPMARAVNIVANRPMVGAPCLGRSMVLWFLVRRRGIDAELVIGAEPPKGGDLSAHAWVELDGVPVNDVAGVRQRFGSFDVQLPRLSTASA
jgi:Transglutaminase-like superfamily